MVKRQDKTPGAITSVSTKLLTWLGNFVDVFSVTLQRITDET